MHTDKILSWSSIKRDDIDSLDKFCILLISSRNAMLCMPPKERELDHPTTIRGIIKKTLMEHSKQMAQDRRFV